MTLNLRRTPHETASETTLECVYQPMRDAKGKVTGVLVHGIDRTEQARAQAHDSFLLMLSGICMPAAARMRSWMPTRMRSRYAPTMWSAPST